MSVATRSDRYEVLVRQEHVLLEPAKLGATGQCPAALLALEGVCQVASQVLRRLNVLGARADFLRLRRRSHHLLLVNGARCVHLLVQPQAHHLPDRGEAGTVDLHPVAWFDNPLAIQCVVVNDRVFCIESADLPVRQRLGVLVPITAVEQVLVSRPGLRESRRRPRPRALGRRHLRPIEHTRSRLLHPRLRNSSRGTAHHRIGSSPACGRAPARTTCRRHQRQHDQHAKPSASTE